jgi:RNA polymerase sigma-70 factor (sigma-E family)
VVSVGRDRDSPFTEYVSTSLPALRRLAYVLCHDRHKADDLVQAAVTRLYVRWARAVASDNLDAYVRTILFREFLHERRSSWARRVHLSDELPGPQPTTAHDSDTSIDLRTALGNLPPGQRAVLVLRFYCDLNVDQTAQILGCSQGSVKSQTAKGLAKLRRVYERATAASVIKQTLARPAPHDESESRHA